jgi:HSP20 family protein
MPEPQANVHSEQASPKENAGTRGAQSEARSFGEAGARAVGSAGLVAKSAIQGGREIAETGRQAGQSMGEAWRHSLDPFMSFQLDVNRWFDDFWRSALGMRLPTTVPAFQPMGMLGGGLFGLPPADLKETENAHILTLELPGLSREDVEITIESDVLAICGQKTQDNDRVGASYRMNERRYGRFKRAFPLPPDVDRRGIEAQFRDGLLTVTLPKKPEAASQRAKIEIKG